MYNIYINDYYFNLKNQWTVLQVCVLNNIDIPRFCFHEKLLIAGNCRMCLVEEMKQFKPVVSCSILINDNMFIYTNTLKVKKAREAVMEFLLINHPLDCPICDQGGECDLQDQAMIFGSDKGRFYEYKRSVENKDCGVFVKTIMNRCIHCTRCVRFVNEYIDSSLGVTGRGSKMEIGFYINKIINTEVIGNIIDLCPVGALTSKPYSFLARPWELKSFNSLDILDSFHSNIRFDVRGSNILRVLPKINDNLNEEWINDKIRFCYDGLRLQRLISPMINKSFKFIKVNWIQALNIIKKNFYLLLKNINKNKFKYLNLNNFINEYLDLESLLMLKLFNNNYNFKLFNNNYNEYKINDFSTNFTLNIDNLNIIKNCIFININIRLSLPNLNIRFKNLYNKKDINFYYIGFYSNFLFYFQNIGVNILIFLNILEGLHWICNKLYLNIKHSFIFYNSLLNCNFLNKINIYFNFLNLQKIILKSNEYAINLLNFNNTNSVNFLKTNFIFYNLAFNDKNILYNKNNLIIYQGFIGDINTLNSNIILPSTNFIEKNTSYFNLMGLYQKTNLILSKLGFSKHDWQIIKILLYYLGKNLQNLNNFSFKDNIDIFKLLYFKYFLFYKNLYNLKYLPLKYKININNNLFFSYQNFYFNDVFSKVSKNINLQNILLNKNFNFEKKYSTYNYNYYNNIQSQDSIITSYNNNNEYNNQSSTVITTGVLSNYIFLWYPKNIDNHGYPMNGIHSHPWIKDEVIEQWNNYKQTHGQHAHVPIEIQKQVMWCDPEKFGNFHVANALENEFINVYHEGSECVRKARKYLRAWTHQHRPYHIPKHVVYYIGPSEGLYPKVIYFIHDKSNGLIKNMIHGDVRNAKEFFKTYESLLGIEFNDEEEFNKGVSYDTWWYTGPLPTGLL